VALGKYSIISDIKKIVSLGINVHIVIAKNDDIFEYQKMRNSLAELKDSVHSIEILKNEKYGHDSFWLNPNHTAKLVSKLLY
jgi:homoserine acetyltransferase